MSKYIMNHNKNVCEITLRNLSFKCCHFNIDHFSVSANDAGTGKMSDLDQKGHKTNHLEKIIFYHSVRQEISVKNEQ